MSKLREELRRTDTHVTGCKTCHALITLPDEDHVALIDALRDPSRTHTSIATALTNSGYKISESSIRRHRKSCRHESEGHSQHP